MYRFGVAHQAGCRLGQNARSGSMLLHHLVSHGVGVLSELGVFWIQVEQRHCTYLEPERGGVSDRKCWTRTNKATAFGDTRNLKMHGQSNIPNAARAGKANNKLVKGSRDRLLLGASQAM